MARQLTLMDFHPTITICKGWAHEYGGRGWIYRSNAEEVVHDLNTMPSGMGIWPRIMKCSGRFGYDEGWDLNHFQCRGSGGILKMIRSNGDVQDLLHPFVVEYDNGKPNLSTTERFPISSAYIDEDELVIETEDGRLWSEVIVPDSDCRSIDIHPFDPENDPEHFLIACLRAGCTGGDLVPLAELPCSFSIIHPFRPEMSTVFRLSEITGIIPRLRQTVPMSDEFKVQYAKRKANDSIRRVREESRQRREVAA